MSDLVFLWDLGEKQCDLQAHAPRGCAGWTHRISENRSRNIHRLKAQAKHASSTATQRYDPSISFSGLPVCGENRRGCQIPALLQVVVDEILQGHLIDIGT